MISIKQPAEKQKSYLDGAISISDIYGPLLSAMENVENESYNKSLQNLCILGMGWAIVGGICQTLRLKNSLAVSGLTESIKVFDDIEKGKLKHIDYIEAYSCPQGCVGGSLTVENLYISYNKIVQLIETLQYEKIKACPDISKDNVWYRTTLTELLDLLAEGKLDPMVAARIPLSEAARAHGLLERGGYAGKVVLVTDA